jgi:hypothetical protein
MTLRLLALLALLVTAAATAASSPVPEVTAAPGRIVYGSSPAIIATSAQPKPLRGVPLIGSTGLRLLVANAPPFLLDVDTGRVTRISGLKIRGHAVVTVHAVGKDAIVRLQRTVRATTFPRAEIYVVRRGTTKAVRLANAWEVAPSSDGSAVWLKAFDDARSCSLREIGLDGSERRSPRPVSCSARLVATSSGPVLIDGTSIVDPSTGETLLDAIRLWAIVGDFAVTAEGQHGPLAVTDLRSGERWTLRYPSRIAGQGGLDEAAVHPRRGLAALSFSDPAYEFGGTQVTDVWLLEPASRNLRHLPDMPAAVSLKSTSMTWTSDGRLVMLAETGQRNVVAIWRPGWNRMRVRPVRLPARNSGSDAFAVWPATRSR